MNKIYRLIWSNSQRNWVVVAETTNGRGKQTQTGRIRRLRDQCSKTANACLYPLKLLTTALLIFTAGIVHAAPTGGDIISGNARIRQLRQDNQVTTTTIDQTSQKLVINWQDFSIGATESVRFNQPNATAVALNRVLGQNPSEILGSMSANGQVFVVNPNGVLFGAGAQVNVGGMVATSLNISDADFNAGNYTFSKGATTGSVVNQGTLTAADAGYIALLGPQVKNEGVITAQLGTALLAAGDKVNLSLNNGSLVSYNIEQGALDALAENKNLIRANGGKVFMNAQAAQDALAKAVVNNTGIIEAQTLSNHNGTITLSGDIQVGTVKTNTLEIVSTKERTVVDWNSFDIAASDRVVFHQPSANSVILNRVHSDAPAAIMGTLTANGTLVISDSYGMLFGPTALVDVGNLLATTAGISDVRFKADGSLSFNQLGHADAVIANAGTITAKTGGWVNLVAPNLFNSGLIEATHGSVQMASGDAVRIDLASPRQMTVTASDALTSQLVSNTGEIEARGGLIQLTTAAGATHVNSLITVDGSLNATAQGQQAGEIFIYAEGNNAVIGNVAANKGKKSGNSEVLVSGSLDVSGRHKGEHGGKLTVTGDNVGLLDGTVIDASGYEGQSGTTNGLAVSAHRNGAAGGDIRIGGDYLGSGDTPTAQNLYVDAGVLVVNDSLHQGDAGRSIFWSDDTTHFYGNIYSRALGGQVVDGQTWHATQGGNAGDGGFVETSGHGHLDAGGYVDLTASQGKRGTYFLDPTNITIYGNVDPSFTSTDSSINLSSNLKLWLDASNTSKVTLDYSSMSTTATGTSGATTITTAANIASSLAVGARIRLGSAGSTTTADTLGSDTYTISAISGTTITLSSALTTNYSASTVYQGYVSQVTDQSSSALNATQSTAGYRPLWLSNGTNGIGTLKFDGSNDRLTNITAPLAAGTKAYTYFSTFSSTTNSGCCQVVYEQNTSTATNSARSAILLNSGNFTFNGERNDKSFGSYAANTWYTGDITRIDASSNNVRGTYGSTDTVSSITNSGVGSSGGYSVGHKISSNSEFMSGQVGEVLVYNTALTGDAYTVLQQYQSAKWGIALSPSGTGETEVAKATASDGYSAFTTRYLERLSQSANISLQATNNIALDLKGDTLNFSTSGRSLTLSASNQITTASTGTITTNNGNISLTGTNGIVFGHAFTLNSANGNIALNNATTLNANLSINAGSGTLTLGSTVNGANNLSATAGTVSLGGAIGGTTALNNVSISATNGLTLPAISAASISATTSGGGSNLTLNGTLSATGSASAITLTSSNQITTASTGTITANNGNINLTGTNGIVFGHAFTLNSANGNIALNNATTLNANLSMNAGNGTLTLGSTVNGANNLTATAGTFSLGGAIGGTTALNNVSISATNGLTLPAINAASILATTSGAASDLTLNGILTASGSGTPITLVANRNFINNIGSNALATENGRWLVYSSNPSNDTTGSLSNNFRRFNCTYDASCPTLGTGNGLLYTHTPTITATSSATVSLTYGDAVPSLSGHSYIFTGYLGSDSAADTITGTFTGSTTYTQGANVGNYNINYSGSNLASAMGYNISYPNNLSAITVNTKTLSAALQNSITKTYDGSQSATLSGSNYTISGVYGTDDVTLSNYTSGTYDTKNVGTGKTVTVSGLTLSGAKAANYTLASTSLSGAIADITAKQLTVSASSSHKVYDATTTADVTLESDKIAGDTVTLNKTSASFADKNVGTGKTVTVSGISLSGTDATNYTLTAESASTTADITAKELTITGTTAANKTYDGGTTASVSVGSLSGFVGTETVSVSASGTFADKNAGNGKTVTASYTLADGSNGGLASNYTLANNTTTANIAATSITPTPSAIKYTTDTSPAAAVVASTAAFMSSASQLIGVSTPLISKTTAPVTTTPNNPSISAIQRSTADSATVDFPVSANLERSATPQEKMSSISLALQPTPPLVEALNLPPTDTQPVSVNENSISSPKKQEAKSLQKDCVAGNENAATCKK